jgi:hypothetical protein
MTETPFRIGGYYRQRDGRVVQVLSDGKYTGINNSFYPRGVALSLASGGYRNIDGKCLSIVGTPIPNYDLLPGELHQINGEWVPRGVPVEDKPATAEPEWLFAARARTAQKRAADPTYERTRPALTWADSKRVDRFPGFIVERFDADEGNEAPAATHPLQRIAQEGDQLHGSAFLRKG